MDPLAGSAAYTAGGCGCALAAAPIVGASGEGKATACCAIRFCAEVGLFGVGTLKGGGGRRFGPGDEDAAGAHEGGVPAAAPEALRRREAESPRGWVRRGSP
eukprot:g8251.t1